MLAAEMWNGAPSFLWSLGIDVKDKKAHQGQTNDF